MGRIGFDAACRRAAGVAVLVAAGTLSALTPSAASAAANGPDLRAPGSHGGGSANSPLIDHSGPVIANPSVFTVFWGTGFPADTDAGVSDFLSNLNSVNADGTSYLHITSQYMRGATTTAAAYTKDSSSDSATDTSTPPTKSPSVSTIVNEVASVLNTHGLRPSSSTVYLVFTSNFPKGGSFCAWHSGGTISGTPVAVAYLPNTANVPGCLNSLPGSPYSMATQGLVNSTSHEFMESITDPQITAWYDQSGKEIGDKCETLLSSITLGATTWQIQPEWSNNASGCVSSA